MAGKPLDRMNRHEVADAGRLVNGRAGEDKYANTIVQVRPIACDDPAGTKAHRKIILSKPSAFGIGHFVFTFGFRIFFVQTGDNFSERCFKPECPDTGAQDGCFGSVRARFRLCCDPRATGQSLYFQRLPGGLFPTPARDFC